MKQKSMFKFNVNVNNLITKVFKVELSKPKSFTGLTLITRTFR